MADLKSPVNAHDHAQGEAHAPITLVEYGDFQCPHCRIAHTVVGRIQRHFGQRLRFVFRNFPLVDMHPMAEPAAEVAEFADTQRKYWPMYDAIFANQGRLTPELIAAEAAKLGLDPAEAIGVIDGQRFAERIERDLKSGEQSGVHGTPTFFINGRHYPGPWEYEELKEAIEAASPAA